MTNCSTVEGWMKKKGGFFGKKMYWFMLTSNSLIYFNEKHLCDQYRLASKDFRDEDDIKWALKNLAKGAIPLQGTSLTEGKGENWTKTRMIYLLTKDNKIEEFECDTEAQCMEWKNALKNETLNPVINPRQTVSFKIADSVFGQPVPSSFVPQRFTARRTRRDQSPGPPQPTAGNLQFIRHTGPPGLWDKSNPKSSKRSISPKRATCNPALNRMTGKRATSPKRATCPHNNNRTTRKIAKQPVLSTQSTRATNQVTSRPTDMTYQPPLETIPQQEVVANTDLLHQLQSQQLQIQQLQIQLQQQQLNQAQQQPKPQLSMDNPNPNFARQQPQTQQNTTPNFAIGNTSSGLGPASPLNVPNHPPISPSETYKSTQTFNTTAACVIGENENVEPQFVKPPGVQFSLPPRQPVTPMRERSVPPVDQNQKSQQSPNIITKAINVMSRETSNQSNANPNLNPNLNPHTKVLPNLPIGGAPLPGMAGIHKN